ncbi:TetR/AcrR family transcriptional regulator [Haliangium ochraceum]|uniref:Transcriptional regulator, TetR family n=1 Tax=Haliangium ochraceum (strain DSM 14365 / JCM 11303 / SMP-2) TaxID=502025 RepID=D0LWU0_HALO1|nr:TetR/AcrR family transcriptional regulator [Haliangium ochraceum]ACY14187.1 transcriptional regulator, TetR family [Haliangium ochraceum DSM 14365]
MSGSSESKKKPRRRDAERTRTAILDAAQELFSEKGFSNTGVREVADLAGVNSALVGRYFGSKEGLYRAALDRWLDVTPILRSDRGLLAEEIVAAFFSDSEALRPLAMMILSAADPVAHEVSIELLHSKIIEPMAEWLGPPDGAGRAARLSALWTGFLTSLRLLPLEPLRGEHAESSRRWLVATTQAIIDGDDI